MEERPASGQEHIGALDGLRAIAVTLVLLYHFTPERQSSLGMRSLLLKVADGGWSGVDLFFVLSGFLITGKLLAARASEGRFRNFYTRRVRRIFPLYYAALAVSFVLLPLLSSSWRVPLLHQLPFWLYLSNFWPVTLGDLPVRLGHFWSLAIEEQFYAVWPALIFVTTRRAAIRVCTAILFVCPAIRLALAMSGAGWEATYAWTFSRADGLAAGALIALLSVTTPRLTRYALVAMTLSAPLLLWSAWHHTIVLVFKADASPVTVACRTLLPSAFALFYAGLLVVALRVQAVARLLTNIVFTLLARYSYGMYVFHFMLLTQLEKIVPRTRLHRLLGSVNRGELAFFVIGFAITTLLAALSYEMFESRFLVKRRPLT